MHCPIACRHAAIDAQARHGDPGIGRHRFDEIARLIADGLERGARDLRETTLRRQPDQRPSRSRSNGLEGHPVDSRSHIAGGSRIRTLGPLTGAPAHPEQGFPACLGIVRLK